MSFYELVKFIHVVAAILWIGTGFGLVLLAARADAAKDDGTLTRLFNEAGMLAKILFIPSSLVVLLCGVYMTIDVWSFGDLWVTLSLVLYFGTFVTGAFFLGPRAERVGQAVAASGGSPDAGQLHEMRKVLMLARLDYGALFAIVALMVIKPTGDDAGVAVAIFVAVAAWWGYVLSRMRALDAPTGAPVAATP